METCSSQQQFCLRWNNHKSNLLSEFNELLQNEAFTDVTLVVQGPSFIKCHKMVLAACSDYFSTLFTRISGIDNHPLIVLRDVKYKPMKAILEYMYQGEVSIVQNQLSELFQVAEFLEVKGLVSPSGVKSGSPQPTITSIERASSIYSSDNTNTGHTSSSPSTNSSLSYYPAYSKPSHQPDHLAQSAWNLSGLSLAAQSVMSTPLASKAFFSTMYDAEEASLRKKMNSLMVNRDTPILRTVLGQGHLDGSEEIPLTQNDPHHDVYRSSSNESANDINDERRSSLDLSHGGNAYSSFPPDPSAEADDKKFSPHPQQNRKSKEWKRYKQYTKEHMDRAIEEVKAKRMTALKAAGKYGIPSRTLYDKVKKMGIITQRNGRRQVSASGAHFPHGIGGNRNGSIYATVSDNDHETLMESSSALLDMAYGHPSETSLIHENGTDNNVRSPEPEDDLPIPEIEQQDNDNHVQDLSMNRKNVIVTPTNISVKMENEETPHD